MTRPCGSSLKDYTLSCGLGIVAARCGILTLATQPLSKGPLWVTGCRCDDVGMTTGIPQIAADLLRRPGRVGPEAAMSLLVGCI